MFSVFLEMKTYLPRLPLGWLVCCWVSCVTGRTAWSPASPSPPSTSWRPLSMLSTWLSWLRPTSYSSFITFVETSGETKKRNHILKIVDRFIRLLNFCPKQDNNKIWFLLNSLLCTSNTLKKSHDNKDTKDDNSKDAISTLYLIDYIIWHLWSRDLKLDNYLFPSLFNKLEVSR